MINRLLFAMIFCFFGMSSFCKNTDSMENIYKEMQKYRLCMVKSLAGTQPTRICDLAFAMSDGIKGSPNALLLYGPPGTGKTSLAEALAEKAGATFLPYSAATIVKPTQESGAEAIEKAFNKARDIINSGGKVVLFFDEIDSFAKEKTKNTNEDHASELNELQIQVSKYAGNPNIAVVVATNNLNFIGQGLLGHFQKIEIPLPDIKKSKIILAHYLDRHPHDLYNRIDSIAKQVYEAKFSGREIEILVANAYLRSKVVGSEKILASAITEVMIELKKDKGREIEALEKERQKEKIENDMIKIQYDSLEKQQKEKIKWKSRKFIEWLGGAVVSKVGYAIEIAITYVVVDAIYYKITGEHIKFPNSENKKES